MRIAIGADHAGFLLKEHLKQTLQRLGPHVDDHGTDSEASVDYPPICIGVARAVAEGRADRGIVLGGSGQGEQIAANKVAGIRAALVQRSLYRAPVARSTTTPTCSRWAAASSRSAWPTKSSTLWLETPFEGGRHQRRIDQIREAERDDG